MKSTIQGGKLAESRSIFRRTTLARTVGSVSSSSAGTLIGDTGTAAKAGDLVRFETGAYQYQEFPVLSVPDANHFLVGAQITPTVGDTFFNLGFVTPQVDSTGSFVATNPSVGATGTTVPGSATFVAGVDGSGNMRGLSVDSSGNLNVNSIEAFDSTGTLTTTGSTCCDVLTNGCSTVAVQCGGFGSGLVVLQGSTDNTQWDNVPLFDLGSRSVQQYMTYNSTYTANIGGLKYVRLYATNVNASTLTFKMHGNDGSGSSVVTSPSSDAFFATSNLRDGFGNALSSTAGRLSVDGSGVVQPVSLPSDVAPASQNITVVDSGSASNTYANGQVWITGTPTANSAATFALSSVETGMVVLGGTFTGTVQVETSSDGGTTYIPHGIHLIGSALFAALFTQNAVGSINLSGKTHLRIRATAAITGTVTVSLRTSVNPSNVYVANGLKIIDGNATTNPANATVKAASTAAVATDTAFVVAVSPNNTPVLPNGASTSALQTTGNTSLGSIDTKTPALGQALAAASVPVVLPTAQITALTPPTTVTANQGTGGASAWKVDGSGVTQPVSAAALPLPAGAATSAIQSSTIGPVAPGTAAANSTLTGAVYNTSAPAPTNGQQVALQADQYGNLDVVYPDVNLTGAAAQTATVNNILPATSGANATNTANYRSASVQIVSTGTAGTFIFEGCNDNVNFQPIPVYSTAVLTGTPIIAAITASASQIIYTFPITTQYTRLRIATTITGGSIQAFTRISQAAWSPAVMQVAQGTTANLQTTATIASGTVTTVGSMTSGNLGIPTIAADVTSGAITTTTTTGTITPTFGTCYSINIPVTAVSGTTPTMQITVQESADTAGNWYNVYSFPIITAVGSYNSPVITMTGNRIRYVQTIAGTTPSFTRAINRLQSSQGNIATPRSNANAPVYNAYGTTSITTSAYTQLIASTTSNASFVDIFDSSGQAMILAVGPVGSEVIQYYVAPGGEQFPLTIPAGSRVAYKALTANATAGYLTINLLT